MTQTMRDKLKALADYCEGVATSLESGGISISAHYVADVGKSITAILATEPAAVTVSAGWIAKDTEGVAWFSSKPSYREDCEWWDSNGAMHRFLDGAITDPWPDYPNGGPECLREVK